MILGNTWQNIVSSCDYIASCSCWYSILQRSLFQKCFFMFIWLTNFDTIWFWSFKLPASFVFIFFSERAHCFGSCVCSPSLGEDYGIIQYCKEPGYDILLSLKLPNSLKSKKMFKKYLVLVRKLICTPKTCSVSSLICLPASIAYNRLYFFNIWNLSLVMGPFIHQ